MNKVVLFDLEHNMPTANLLRELVQHYPTVYLFNCQGKFEYALDDLTEFSSWLNSCQIVVLDIPKAEHKEYEYAVLVGQLLALLEPDVQIEVISAMPGIEVLMQLLAGAEFFASLIPLEKDAPVVENSSKYQLPSAKAFQDKPALQLVKKYCDALGKMAGKPTTLDGLKNSVSNILQVLPDKTQQLVGMLINLKIVKRYDEQIAFRKKVLKQWLQLKLDDGLPDAAENLASAETAEVQPGKDLYPRRSLQDVLQQQRDTTPHDALEKSQQDFAKIDELQWEMVQQLGRLKSGKPKDIFELRDLLEKIYPQADIKRLLKELLEKGYIYWNGHEVLYSHEMLLQ